MHTSKKKKKKICETTYGAHAVIFIDIVMQVMAPVVGQNE